eukprot:112403-Chlamydomonas_euryale.AAC.2
MDPGPRPSPAPRRKCGVDGQRIAFLFTDNHIVDESFVEDINSLLNSGDITGLFPAVRAAGRRGHVAGQPGAHACVPANCCATTAGCP